MGMTTRPDHTVEIGDYKTRAYDYKDDIPFSLPKWEKFEVEKGPDRWYKRPSYQLRKCSFKFDMEGDIYTSKQTLEKLCQDAITFSSLYTGTFKAFVTPKSGEVKNGFPDLYIAEVEIQEVQDDSVSTQ